MEESGRAEAVIDRIRVLVERAPVSRGRLDIDELILEVVALARSEAIKHGVTVRTLLAKGMQPVEGGRVQLQQVILNLVINSIEAMSAHGSNHCKLVLSAEQEVCGGALVSVRDSGPGLTPDGLERVFEPFYTTKFDGFGLGLSIRRSIIEAHGRQLWARANEPCGALFQFSLPA